MRVGSRSTTSQRAPVWSRSPSSAAVGRRWIKSDNSSYPAAARHGAARLENCRNRGVYLLDTNIVSELRKPRPHGAVVAWLEGVADADLHLCSVTLGEIQAGIE